MLLIRNSQSLTARLGGEQFGSPPKQQRYFEEAISLSRACSFYLKQIHNFFFLSLSRKLVFLISNCWCFFFLSMLFLHGVHVASETRDRNVSRKQNTLFPSIFSLPREQIQMNFLETHHTSNQCRES